MEKEDVVGGYHLTGEQLSEICQMGGLAPSACDIAAFDCHCDAFLHNERSTDESLDGAYDLARFAARNPQKMELPHFTHLFCKKSQQVAFLSHKFYKDGLQEHINTWELVRILFCDFFGDFASVGERDPERPPYLPDDETCRETTESLTRLPGQTPELQLLCRCLHWLEQTARRSDWHDATYLNSVTRFDKSCASSAIFDPDSNPTEYKRMRLSVDLSEPVFYALRRGDPSFAAEMLLKNKEYWFSSFIRLCAPTFFNVPYAETDEAAEPPRFLPDQPNVPLVHVNASEAFKRQRIYFQDEAKKDNGQLLLPRHKILHCGSSAPHLLHGLELLRSLNSDLIDDKCFMQKALSALANANFLSTGAADQQLSGQDFLWKKLRAAWVSIVESKVSGKPIDSALFNNLATVCKSKLSDDPNFFWENIQVHLVCAALAPSPAAHLSEMADFAVRFVSSHKKSGASGFGQELAFCANFFIFLNAALRIRNCRKAPAILSGVSKKFTGLDHNDFSLPKLVFHGQIFGGCMFEGQNLGNFYASHVTKCPPQDPTLWQKLGLMIACCNEEPEEKCMQLFCSSVINHPDIAKLREWQSDWVEKKRDHFHSHKLSEALADASKAAAGGPTSHHASGRFHESPQSAHRSSQTDFDAQARDMYTQICLESNARAKQKLVAQLAKMTLNWSKRELASQDRTSASRLLGCLGRDLYSQISIEIHKRARHCTVWLSVFHPFLEDDGRWGVVDMDGISLSDVAELYGLFKAAEVADRIKIVSDWNEDLDLSFSRIPELCDRLDDLKRSFQQLFWPSLSADGAEGPFHLMHSGIWNEWDSQAPIRSLNMIPRLVEEVLQCCRSVRQKVLQLLCSSAVTAETAEAKELLAALYRRIHDTVQSITIDLADRSAARRSNVKFYANRLHGRSPLEVLFSDGDSDVLHLLMAFAAEDRFGLRDRKVGERPDDWS